ncbi:hypothetical protein BLNAU_7824 [Blattamonas nauphoetae]|uniref:Uncharacterized protein n=1 Tax=Blattamonas nauphoetae TaxID=2049346 RepID=A0ABQ9Y0G7_9EUKA|nr:hypothetical protein BLNAU_7824 [Blattamonas nauphoetae]
MNVGVNHPCPFTIINISKDHLPVQVTPPTLFHFQLFVSKRIGLHPGVFQQYNSFVEIPIDISPYYPQVLLPPFVDFGSFQVGRTYTRDFTFKSKYDIEFPFVVDAHDLHSDVTISTTSGTIPATGNLVFSITFKPTSQLSVQNLGRLYLKGYGVRTHSTVIQCSPDDSATPVAPQLSQLSSLKKLRSTTLRSSTSQSSSKGSRDTSHRHDSISFSLSFSQTSLETDTTDRVTRKKGKKHSKKHSSRHHTKSGDFRSSKTPTGSSTFQLTSNSTGSTPHSRRTDETSTSHLLSLSKTPSTTLSLSKTSTSKTDPSTTSLHTSTHLSIPTTIPDSSPSLSTFTPPLSTTKPSYTHVINYSTVPAPSSSSLSDTTSSELSANTKAKAMAQLLSSRTTSMQINPATGTPTKAPTPNPMIGIPAHLAALGASSDGSTTTSTTPTWTSKTTSVPSILQQMRDDVSMSDSISSSFSSSFSSHQSAGPSRSVPTMPSSAFKFHPQQKPAAEKNYDYKDDVTRLVADLEAGQGPEEFIFVSYCPDPGRMKERLRRYGMVSRNRSFVKALDWSVFEFQKKEGLERCVGGERFTRTKFRWKETIPSS